MEPRLFTRKEAAEMLRIGTSTLDAWARRGLIRPIHLGRRVLYPSEEVERIARQGIPWIRRTP